MSSIVRLIAGGIAAVILVIAPGMAAQDKAQAPYAGQDQRDIKALSAQDVADLLAGSGWGFAKPAELNGYPGPAHVLEAADQLALSDDVRKAVQDVFDGMNAEARRLGSEYVAAEQALDELFASGSADTSKIDELTARAADLRAGLRAVHLKAHLEVLPLLSRHQRMIYAQIRGYGNGGHTDHGGHGSHQ